MSENHNPELVNESPLDKADAYLLDQIIAKEIQTYFMCLVAQMLVNNLNSYEELQKLRDNDQVKDQIADKIVADLITNIEFSLSEIANLNSENAELTKEDLMDQIILTQIQNYFISLVQQMLDSDLTLDQIVKKLMKIKEELLRIQKDNKDMIVKKVTTFLIGTLAFFPK